MPSPLKSISMLNSILQIPKSENKIVGDVTKKNYSKDKIMNELKRYNEEILKLYNPVIAENSHVGKVYNFDNNKYIANIVVSPSENNFYIIFIINTSDMTYKIDLVM